MRVRKRVRVCSKKRSTMKAVAFGCRTIARCGISHGPSNEACRYRQNWVVLTVYSTLVGFSYSCVLPSLHQFVTSSAHPDHSHVQPGLELSETWYSWIVSILSVGEFTGAVVTSFLQSRIFTKFLMLTNLFLCGLGGLLYGVGKYGWMLLIGRFLVGVYVGAGTVILRTYIGETSSAVIAAMPDEKREKSTLKYTAFFLSIGVSTLSLAFGPGVSFIMAQISGVDQFRWPGYFTVVYSILLAVLTVLWFRENAGDVQKKGSSLHVKNLPIPIYTLVCLVAAFFVMNWYFAVFETLLNPILTDNFGFDIEYDSYAFFGTLLFLSVGLIFLYTLQRHHVDNRISGLIALCVALCGSLIATDWQALSGDPCSQFSNTEYLNMTDDGLSSTRTESWCDVNSRSFHCIANQSDVDLNDCEMSDNDVLIFNSSCVCEAFSHSQAFNCYWNPHSRVTGRDCLRCARLCRSRDHSLNLVQFLVGMSLVSCIIALGCVSVTLIASDALAGQSQALIMGTFVAMGALGRITGPVWGNAVYLAADHHVYIVMNILSGSAFLVIVTYILLYRTMKPSSLSYRQSCRRTDDSSFDIELDSLMEHVDDDLDIDIDGEDVSRSGSDTRV